MKQITITNQREFDNLPDTFGETTQINIIANLYNINRTPINSCINVSGSATIQHVSGSATIQDVSGSATIQDVFGSATIQHVSGSATIQDVSGSATIQRVSGSATIQRVFGSATIQDVFGSATIQRVYENAIITIVSNTAIIEKALQESIIIFKNCTNKIFDCESSVTVLHKNTAKHNLKTFLTIYNLTETENNYIILYKSINPKNNCDFYTGKIKYEGVVTCPDWNSDTNIQCGCGLHLSPTPENALQYNKGKILKCKVNIKDISIYPYDITKVRCKKVEVIEEMDYTT